MKKQEYTPTLSQWKATAKFHRRAEAAYRSIGNIANAEKARKCAEHMETKIKEMENGENA